MAPYEDYNQTYHGSARLTRARGEENSTAARPSLLDAETAPSRTSIEGAGADGVANETAALLTALAAIIDPPITARSLRTSLRIIIEALIRARDRAVPAGTSIRDAQLAHARIVALLHRVAQSERG